MKRIAYLDTFKFIAIFIIYTTHFIASFNSDVFVLWNEYPFKFLLGGVSGKFGVTIFATILGYLSYNKGQMDKDNNYVVIFYYFIKRYIYFVVAGFAINICYFLLGHISTNFAYIEFKDVIIQSLLISNKIYPTFWCMRDFLFGSTICYILGYFQPKDIFFYLILTILFQFGYFWVAICLIGIKLIAIENLNIIKKRWMQFLLIVVVFIVIKRPENYTAYIIDALCSIILIAVVRNNKKLLFIFNNKFTSTIGEKSMAIFLIHSLTYSIFGNQLFTFLNINNYFHFFIVWIICWAIICALSFPVDDFLKRISKIIANLILHL